MAMAATVMLLGGCGGGDGSSSSGTAVSMQQTAANQQLSAQAASQPQAPTANQTYIDLVAYSAKANDGLAPAQFQAEGDTIIGAVRRDDSFADPATIPLRFSSDHPDVLRVDPGGVITGVAPGVATVTATSGGASATAAFVVG